MLVTGKRLFKNASRVAQTNITFRCRIEDDTKMTKSSLYSTYQFCMYYLQTRLPFKNWSDDSIEMLLLTRPFLTNQCDTIILWVMVAHGNVYRQNMTKISYLFTNISIIRLSARLQFYGFIQCTRSQNIKAWLEFFVPPQNEYSSIVEQFCHSGEYSNTQGFGIC